MIAAATNFSASSFQKPPNSRSSPSVLSAIAFCGTLLTRVVGSTRMVTQVSRLYLNRRVQPIAPSPVNTLPSPALRATTDFPKSKNRIALKRMTVPMAKGMPKSDWNRSKCPLIH